MSLGRSSEARELQLMSFGKRVFDIAMGIWSQGLTERDHKPEIRAVLGLSIVPWDAYCGKMAEEVWLRAGVDGEFDSVGKALYGWGYGNRMSSDPEAALAFESYPEQPRERVLDRLVSDDLELIRIGDIILHQASPRSYNGHVMIALSGPDKRGQILTFEGNAKGYACLPGKPSKLLQGEGLILNVRSIRDGYIDWLLRPSADDIEDTSEGKI